MTLIPSSTPPAQTHTVSSPAKALLVGRSPGRLDIGLIENRLFGGSGTAPRPDVAKPTRDIGSTLSQFRSAASSVAVSRPSPAQPPQPTKRVQFAEHHAKETVDSSFGAMAARVGVDLTALGHSQCLMENGDSLPASIIKNQLMMCLNWNRDEALVSSRSKALLREAFYEARSLPGKVACRPGDYPYDVLEAFLTVVEQKRPALLSAD
ncbi:hypothetical protein [Stenotrophomonas sp.]|uniref:hypothetical protein n=1 Tax=Stenotrophomonas sp. TaxID=69392 RepID=UPI0028ADAA96|nr:hypothetical protein [Stenotrophomonas sp.]